MKRTSSRHQAASLLLASILVSGSWTPAVHSAPSSSGASETTWTPESIKSPDFLRHVMTLQLGSTIRLGAGEFAPIRLPPGIGVQGAGIGATVIVAQPDDYVAISLQGASTPSRLSDLSIRDADPAANADNLDYRVSKEIEVSLLPGDNRFESVALNTARIESAPSILELRYRQPSAAAERPMRLHLVVVGVDEYQNSNYNLNYAVTDAGAFRDAVLAGSAKLFADTRVTFLSDAEVSRESVLEAFHAIAAEAGPEDALVFFYAGHGVMSQSEKPEFYLVPPDVTQLYGADDQLATRGIAASELRALAQSISAQKQLFVLDACQSAGAFQGFGARGAAEEKAIAQLARSTGTHWLAASGSTQFAAEFEELGHGAFTYALLEAFEGKAAAPDGALTIRDLDAFLQTRVPELTREHRSSPQYPASYGYGQDFPIALIQ